MVFLCQNVYRSGDDRQARRSDCLKGGIHFVIYSQIYYSKQDLFQELNKYFREHTFLVGHRISIADMAVYLAVAPIVDGLHVSDKERFVHLSRWFSHIQLTTSLRGNKPPVSFATLQLSAFEVASGH